MKSRTQTSLPAHVEIKEARFINHTDFSPCPHQNQGQWPLKLRFKGPQTNLHKNKDSSDKLCLQVPVSFSSLNQETSVLCTEEWRLYIVSTCSNEIFHQPNIYPALSEATLPHVYLCLYTRPIPVLLWVLQQSLSSSRDSVTLKHRIFHNENYWPKNWVASGSEKKLAFLWVKSYLGYSWGAWKVLARCPQLGPPVPVQKKNEKSDNLCLPVLCLGVELEESLLMEKDWPLL